MSLYVVDIPTSMPDCNTEMSVGVRIRTGNTRQLPRKTARVDVEEMRNLSVEVLFELQYMK